MEEYEILKYLIKCNTIKDKENLKIINYLEKVLKNLGFDTEYKDKCLIMSIGKEQKIGFLGHTDTVEYIEGWNTNPFELTKINDKLYGLGVCDMKGGIAAIIDANIFFVLLIKILPFCYFKLKASLIKSTAILKFIIAHLCGNVKKTL